MSVDLFYLGDWQVTAVTNTVRKGNTVKQIEPKAMDVLVLLCQQNGQVLSADDIINQCWQDSEMGDNPIHKVITQIRKALDDKASAPTYIETIRKRGYRIIADVTFVLNEEQGIDSSEWQGKSPFPGLSAFSAEQAPLFFGRNAQILTLLERTAQFVKKSRAFCLLLGPSGTGKSSLVNAGVLPKLLDDNGYDGIGVVSYTALDLADVSDDCLLLELASTLIDWEVNDQGVFDGLSADKLAQLLHSNIDLALNMCQSALEQSVNQYASPLFFLFIDRLEVLLSSPRFSEQERARFLQIIEQLASSGHVIVFSACRNDFYPLVVKQPSLMANKDNGAHFDLLPPTRNELMQMIQLPAKVAKLSWSIDPISNIPLDDILCEHAANNPDSLPMLQYTLQELYLQRNKDDQLQVSVYQELGGIEGAIGQKAEEIFLELPLEQQAQLPLLLSQLVTLNADGETITSKSARWSWLLDDKQKAFVESMVEYRLFVSHLQHNAPSFSLAHEALLRRWPRASQWIAQHKESLTMRSRLQHLCKRWLEEGKSSAYLLARGKPLQEAQQLINNQVLNLEPDELGFIHASQKRVAKQKWYTRATMVLLGCLTLIALSMSIKSQQAENLAQEKRLEAESLLGFMVGEFADKLRSVKRMDLLDGISHKALEYFSHQDQQQSSGLFGFADAQQNFKASFQHAQTLSAMGEVAYSRGKTDEAKQAFEAAKVILDNLYVEKSDNLALLKTLGANAFWLGQLAYDQSDFDVAQPLFEAYRDYSERMNELSPNSLESMSEISYANIAIGGVAFKMLEFSKAKVAFNSSLNQINKIIQRSPQNSFYVDKADTLSWLATIEQHLGNLSRALELHQASLDTLKLAINNEENNAYYLELLGTSYFHQAVILNNIGRYQDSYSNASLSVETLKMALNQDPNNKKWKESLFLSEVYQIKLSAKNEYLNLEVLAQLYMQKLLNNSVSVPNNFLYLLEHLIGYHQSTNQWRKSEELIARAKMFYIESAGKNKSNVDVTRSYSEILLLEAKQFFYKNKFNAQIKACNSVINILKPLLKKSKNIDYLYPFVRAHSCIEKIDLIPKEVMALKEMRVPNFNF